YLVDRELLRSLEESRTAFENLQRVQGELIQKEKMVSIGGLAAGVAHEINNPVAAILGYSELLASTTVTADQSSMIAKIAHQARRTRDLVSNMLNFAQQAPADKSWLDLGSLLQRTVQVEGLRMGTNKITIALDLESNLPRIWGNSNQLVESFLQITANAKDA